MENHTIMDISNAQLPRYLILSSTSRDAVLEADRYRREDLLVGRGRWAGIALQNHGIVFHTVHYLIRLCM